MRVGNQGSSWSVPRLATILAVLVGLAVCDLDAVPRREEAVTAAWSEVLNQYHSRAEVVPNLVATVKSYTYREQTMLTRVLEARAVAAQTQAQLPADAASNPGAFRQFEQSQAGLKAELNQLLAASEYYPDLRSNGSFLALTSELQGAETRIAAARKDYIEAVETYNTTLRTIPGRWIAAWLYPDAKARETFAPTEPVLQVSAR